MSLAAIVAFHAPFAASADLIIIHGCNGGEREDRQLRGRRDLQIAVGMAAQHRVAHRELAIERREIHQALDDFGRAAGFEIQPAAETIFEILYALDLRQIDAVGSQVKAQRTVFPIVGRMIVVAAQRHAGRAVARFSVR